MKNKFEIDYLLFTVIACLAILCSMFYELLDGSNIFFTPDYLSPQSFKQAIYKSQQDYTYPYWFPWIMSGMPSIHSFINVSDYYYLNYISKLFYNFGMPWFWNTIFHFLMGSVGMFFLLDEIRLNKYSKVIGSISFALIPYITTMVVFAHGSQMMASMYIPWIVFLLIRLFNDTNIFNVCLLSIFIGLQIQRAHVQIAYYTWMVIGIYMVFIIIKNRKLVKDHIYKFYFLFLSLLIGTGIASNIIFPIVNYSSDSIRNANLGAQSIQYATQWSFKINEILTFIIPSFYGFGGYTYWGSMPFTDYPNYVGLIVFILSLYAIIYSQNKYKWFFINLIILFFLLSLGKNYLTIFSVKFDLYQIFYNLIPYFDKFRVPSMMLIMVQFCFCILASMGLSEIINNHKKGNSTLYPYISIPLFLILFFIILYFFITPNLTYLKNPSSQDTLYNIFKYQMSDLKDIEIVQYVKNIRMNMVLSELKILILFLIAFLIAIFSLLKKKINTRKFSIIIGLLMVCDLVIVNRSIINPNNPMPFINNRKTVYRNSNIESSELLSNYFKKDEIIRFLKKDSDIFRILPMMSLDDNRWAAFNIESISGYHPAKLSNYNKYLIQFSGNGKTMIPSKGILQMLNVKYLIVSKSDLFRLGIADGELRHPWFELVKSGKTQVYKFKYFQRRVFFVDSVKTVLDDNDIYNKVFHDNYNPENTVYINKKLPFKFEPANKSSIVSIDYWSPNKIILSYDIKENQFVVLSEIFYKNGWQIKNNEEITIYKINNLLRGFLLSKGKRTITMVFEPQDLFYGKITSVLSVILILTLLFFHKYKIYFLPQNEEKII